MANNFYTDNPDLQRHLDAVDLDEIVTVLEQRYAYSDTFSDAPRSYADAKDNYRLMLTLLGDICANDIAPNAAEAADEGVSFADGEVTFATATVEGIELLRQADLMGAMLPREYGGLNLPQTIYQMMIEMVSRAEAGLMTVFGLQEISATIAEYGDDGMKDRVLPRFATGEATGAMVLTEPDAGSDLGVAQTRAVLDEETGQWRLSGVKRFITNGNADVMLVLARSEEGSTDARGLSMFELESDETVRIRRIESKMGLHASPTCEVEFRDTPARLVGKRRFGLIRYAMSMMNGARLAVAAQALGISEAAYREAEKYADKRIQFGQPIREIPAVYRMLMSMRGEIEATRSLLYETAVWVDLKRALDHRKARGEAEPDDRQRAKQADRLSSVLTPLVKLHATEMGNRVCYQAMQVLGGAGYMHEFNVERHYRDIRVTSIYEGTSQLQIVAAMGGILGGTLTSLLEDWSAEDFGEDLAPLKATLDDATALFAPCIEHLKTQERELIDYYAADLADMAVLLATCWLSLRDARSDPRKREMARYYIGDKLPLIHARAEAAMATDATPIETKDVVLARAE